MGLFFIREGYIRALICSVQRVSTMAHFFRGLGGKCSEPTEWGKYKNQDAHIRSHARVGEGGREWLSLWLVSAILSAGFVHAADHSCPPPFNSTNDTCRKWRPLLHSRPTNDTGRKWRPPRQTKPFDAVIHLFIYIHKKVRTRCRSPPQNWFLVGCSSPFVRLAEHLTALRAWC